MLEPLTSPRRCVACFNNCQNENTGVVQFIMPHYASLALAKACFALFLALHCRVLYSPSPVLGKTRAH